MNPAWSVICFTVLAGMGQGLFLILVRVAADGADPRALALGGFAVQDAVPPAVHADAAQIAGLLSHWQQSLTDIGFLDQQAPKKLMPRLNQMFNRAGLTEEEVHILRGIAKAMTQASQRKS